MFEQLLHNPGNDTSKDAVIVAKHEDLNEEGQSVHFPMFTQLFTGGKGMRIFVVLGIAGVCIVLLLYWKRKKREN